MRRESPRPCDRACQATVIDVVDDHETSYVGQRSAAGWGGRETSTLEVLNDDLDVPSFLWLDGTIRSLTGVLLTNLATDVSIMRTPSNRTNASIRSRFAGSSSTGTPHLFRTLELNFLQSVRRVCYNSSSLESVDSYLSLYGR